jgi:hypothetical protein
MTTSSRPTHERIDPVPGGLAVKRHGIRAICELTAEQVDKRVVREPGLLAADHVRPPLVEPRQQPRQARLDRVDVPAGDPHRITVATPQKGQRERSAAR